MNKIMDFVKLHKHGFIAGGIAAGLLAIAGGVAIVANSMNNTDGLEGLEVDTDDNDDGNNVINEEDIPFADLTE